METRLQQCPACGAEIDIMTGECPFCGPAAAGSPPASTPASSASPPAPGGAALTDWLEEEETAPSPPAPARPLPPAPSGPRPPAEPVPDIPEAAFLDLDGSPVVVPAPPPAAPRPRVSELPSPVERRDVDHLAARTHEEEVAAALAHLAEGRSGQALATLQGVLLEDPAHVEARQALQTVRLAMLDRQASESAPPEAATEPRPRPPKRPAPAAAAPSPPPPRPAPAPTPVEAPPSPASSLAAPAPPAPVHPGPAVAVPRPASVTGRAAAAGPPSGPALAAVPAPAPERPVAPPPAAAPATTRPAPVKPGQAAAVPAADRPRVAGATRAPRPVPPAAEAGAGAASREAGPVVGHALLPRARPSRAPLALVVGGGLLLVAIVVVVATSGGSKPAPTVPTPPPARSAPAVPVARDIPGLERLPAEIRGPVRAVLEDYAKAMESINPGHLAAVRPDLTRAERDERLVALEGADNVAVELRVVEVAETAPGHLVLVLERTDFVVGGRGGEPATVRETLRLARGPAGWAVVPVQ